jgi:hypothetical protein
MMRMPMVNLAKSPAEVKTDMASMAMPASVGKPSVAEYPYGCCISLDDDCLKKLGLDGDMPGVGESIHGCFIAKVTSASMNERVGEDGVAEQCCRIELQITDMGILSADPADMAMEQSEARRQRFYGKPDSDGDNDGD